VTFSPEQMRKADLNGDLIVDEADLAFYTELIGKKAKMDMNGDGWIDEADVDRLKEVRQGLELLGTDSKEGLKSIADFNRDGVVNQLDLDL